MHFAPNAMACVFADNAEPGIFGNALDCMTHIAKVIAHNRLLYACPHRRLACIEQVLRLTTNFPDGKCCLSGTQSASGLRSLYLPD